MFEFSNGHHALKWNGIGTVSFLGNIDWRKYHLSVMIKCKNYSDEDDIKQQIIIVDFRLYALMTSEFVHIKRR